MIEIRNFIETIDLKYYIFIEFEMSFKIKKKLNLKRKIKNSVKI